MATTIKATKDILNSIIPDNYLYISHLDESWMKDGVNPTPQFWKLPCYPDEISDSMQSTFTPTTALGRTAPIMTYSNSGPRTVQISISLHRDIMDDINWGVSNADLATGEDYVDALIRALQAIALPKYNLQNKYVEPPIVALRLGQEVFIRGVVNGSIGLSYKKPILSNNKYAVVSVSLQITEVDPYDASSVFRNGSFRGVVNTASFKKGMGME